jgi:hypothetical protein
MEVNVIVALDVFKSFPLRFIIEGRKRLISRAKHVKRDERELNHVQAVE